MFQACGKNREGPLPKISYICPLLAPCIQFTPTIGLSALEALAAKDEAHDVRCRFP
jgi:hypothetical protein